MCDWPHKLQNIHLQQSCCGNKSRPLRFLYLKHYFLINLKLLLILSLTTVPKAILLKYFIYALLVSFPQVKELSGMTCNFHKFYLLSYIYMNPRK
jgi:hypothetical protein